MLNSFVELATENPTTTTGVAVACCVVLFSAAYFLRSGGKKPKPTMAGLTAGTIESDQVKTVFDSFSNSYSAGVGIVDKKETASLANTFYDLVTDMYEYFWGESFHFTVPLPGKTELASEAANECRIATLCNLRPGMKALDCGCGVGGPMRTIAGFSGAEVVGITINKHQIKRGNYHNKRYGLDSLCKIVHGTFLKMEFPDNSFDAAYAIDATCHAPDVSVVYGEIFRVIKPGSIFVCYEWVTTPLYDPKNPVHAKAIDDINFGNGLPELRTAEQCIAAAKSVGFELVKEYDIAQETKLCRPWYARLQKLYKRSGFDKAILKTLVTLRLLPKGIEKVHRMLVDNATVGLVTGGQLNIFTPMHLLVLKKPETAASQTSGA